jgi:hypothetical protein
MHRPVCVWEGQGGLDCMLSKFLLIPHFLEIKFGAFFYFWLLSMYDSIYAKKQYPQT